MSGAQEQRKEVRETAKLIDELGEAAQEKA